jgi:hypothetical protein
MTDTDIAAVREAVLLVVDQPAAQEVLDRAKTVEHLELAVGLWTEQRAPRLRPSLLCAALRDAVREPGRQAQWSSIAVRRGWEMAEGWRLLARQHDGPLSDQEDAAIEALCDADLLRLLLASPLLAAPQERLDAVSDTSVQACTESALMVLFRAAAARRAWSLETRVARAAIGSLRRRRMARDELTVALGRGLGAFGAVRGLLERRPEDIVDHLVRWARRHGRKAVEETLWTAWPPS